LREVNQFKNFIHLHQNKKLVLATLIDTVGSSYKKSGAKKLIADCGTSVGLISGGCLEKSIIQDALAMTSPCESRTYDTRSKEDRLFGYSTGCQGLLNIEFKQFAPGDFSFKKEFSEELAEQIDVHILGAGPDIDPLYELLTASGWNCHFYTQEIDLWEEKQEKGWNIQHISKRGIEWNITHPNRTAALLMSHSYPFDLEALSFLADKNIEYTGILGPKKRTQQMLTDLPKVYQKTWPSNRMEHLHGPIGSQNMGRGEWAIALSTVAHLQQVFFGKQL